MMQGGSLPLCSSFRLRYNTLLKLYSMEALQPEALVAHSLHAFQSRDGATPEAAAERVALLAEAELLRCPDEEELAPLLALQQAAAVTLPSRGRHVAVTWPLRGRYVAVTWRGCAAVTLPLRCRYMAVTLPLGRCMAVTLPLRCRYMPVNPNP